MNHRVNCISNIPKAQPHLFFFRVDQDMREKCHRFVCSLGIGGIARLGTFLMRCLIIKLKSTGHGALHGPEIIIQQTCQ